MGKVNTVFYTDRHKCPSITKHKRNKMTAKAKRMFPLFKLRETKSINKTSKLALNTFILFLFRGKRGNL